MSAVDRLAALPAAALIGITVAAAAAVNVVVYALGRLAGGSYDFVTPAGPAHVDALTVIGFSVLPLGIGLIITAVLGRWWRGVFTVAMIVAPALELVTILAMTVPSSHDVISKVALSVCHVVLVPFTLIALAAQRRASRARARVAA